MSTMLDATVFCNRSLQINVQLPYRKVVRTVRIDLIHGTDDSPHVRSAAWSAGPVRCATRC